jgi:AAA domain, putative AbiEii toxin, Type IV TA system
LEFNLQSSPPFQLLKSFSLPDVGEINEPGIIVVVGPNSSGKTQLLKDIARRLGGELRELVVAENVEIVIPPDADQFIAALITAGHLKRDEANPDQLRPQRSDSTNNSQIQMVPASQLKSHHSAFLPSAGKAKGERNEFLVQVSKMLVASLFIDRRFSTLNQVQSIAWEQQPPMSDVHTLYLDDEARKRLAEEIQQSFNKDIWPDNTNGNTVALRVADRPFPESELKLSPVKMRNYRTIEDEGDGLKSYVAICLALLLGQKSISLIDEPELCLHPPQSLRLGRFIGSQGSNLPAWTILSTHSSSFLRGIIESGQKTTIIRLHRKGIEFHAKLLDSSKLSAILNKPNLKAESALDGIFADCAVIVESDGDRIVYGEALNKLNGAGSFSVHLPISSGSGTIPKLCAMYKELNIPVAVIADLDVIFQKGLLRSILKSLDSSKNFTTMVRTATEVADSLHSLKSRQIGKNIEADVEKLLADSASKADASKSASATKLRKMANLIDPTRNLFDSWRTGIDTATRQKLDGLLGELKLVGLFLVPVGALEDWIELGKKPTNNGKGEWAISAVEKVASLSADQSEFLNFVHGVREHLRRALN